MIIPTTRISVSHWKSKTQRTTPKMEWKSAAFLLDLNFGSTQRASGRSNQLPTSNKAPDQSGLIRLMMYSRFDIAVMNLIVLPSNI